MNPKYPKFKFYLDENFPAPAGKFLNKLGHNVKYVVKDKIARAKSDIWQIKYATKLKRIFVAVDKDFKHIDSLKELIFKSSGMILIKSADPKSDKIIEIFKKLLKEFSENKILGKLCIASISQIKYISGK